MPTSRLSGRAKLLLSRMIRAFPARREPRPPKDSLPLSGKSRDVGSYEFSTRHQGAQDDFCIQLKKVTAYLPLAWEGEVTPSLVSKASPSARASPTRMAQVTYPHGRRLVGWAKERSDVPINVSMMGTAPDSSASTTNVPKGAFAHPTRLNIPIPIRRGRRLGSVSRLSGRNAVTQHFVCRFFVGLRR